LLSGYQQFVKYFCFLHWKIFTVPHFGWLQRPNNFSKSSVEKTPLFRSNKNWVRIFSLMIGRYLNFLGSPHCFFGRIYRCQKYDALWLNSSNNRVTISRHYHYLFISIVSVVRYLKFFENSSYHKDQIVIRSEGRFILSRFLHYSVYFNRNMISKH
jgi:hypothetical protein